MQNPDLTVRTFARLAILICLGGLIVLAPWSIRNRVILGKAIWTTTHGGYTLLLANNPILFDHYEKENLGRQWNETGFHEWWAKELASVSLPTESECDKLANTLAWQTIRDRPRGFAYACLARIGWFWAWWPSNVHSASIWMILTIGAWYGISTLMFATAVLIGLVDIRRSFDQRWLPAIALTIGITAVHMFYWSNMRMRAPLLPIIYVACFSLLNRFVNLPARS